MKQTLDNEKLINYVVRQLNTLFPDDEPVTIHVVREVISETIDRIYNCFKHIKNNPYYEQNGTVLFDHLNSDHYCVFLYVLSNIIYRKHGHNTVSTKLFLLNKALHGIDVYYATQLPDVFLFVHPIGTVLGRAHYMNYLIVYQNCTVGSNEEGVYPVFKEGVALFSRASIIGNCTIGNNVVLGANTFILDTQIEDNKVVVGAYPNLKIVENTRNVFDRFFK